MTYFVQSHSITRKQHGAVLIVMLVIMILGTVTFLINSLSSASIVTQRKVKSSDLLVQAKDTVIGYTLTGGSNQPPGGMMLPDVLSNSEPTPNYDGASEGGCFDITKPLNSPPYTPLTSSSISNMRCLGRLPWKNLNLSIEGPSENDPTGYMPWYAFSRNLVDPNTSVNSELLTTNPYPWLTVRDMNGNILSSRVAFVIIIPGLPLNGQTRPTSPNLGGPSQYLDSITVPNTCTAPCIPNTYSNFDLDESFIIGEEHRWINDPANPGKQIDDPNYQFNDKIIYVTIDDLMPLIEKRIAREAKGCLDDYASQNGNKYPWAVPISDTTNYLSANLTRFGRFPPRPNVFTNSPNATTLLDALTSLQTALSKYIINNTSSTRLALKNAGNTLDAAGNNNAPLNNTIENWAQDTGNMAVNLAKNPPQNTVSNVQNGINNLLNSLATAGLISSDTNMSLSWTSNCQLFRTNYMYWSDWNNLLFYQIALGNQPNSTPNCTGTQCLSITASSPIIGNGNFRAAVALAGKMRAGQTRTTAAQQQQLSNYLEGLNQIGKTSSPSTVTFETYNTSDINYQNITNDLVLCLDGDTNCK